MKKKITALLCLSEMDAIQRRIDAPSIPPNYIKGTKYTEKNANDIEKAIERFAKIVGFLAERTKTQGRKLEAKWKDTPHGRVQIQKEQFIPGTGKKGSSDMKLLIKGDYISGEIKFGKDTQKKDQKEYEKKVIENGGIYVIWKTFEDFLIWYTARYGRPPQLTQAINNLNNIW